jgi:hypothetical protein
MGRSWTFNPDSGGTTIPETRRRDVEARIRKYADEHFAGRFTRLDVRFRGQFCYIDAYQEPVLSPGWPPEGDRETREEYAKRLRNTPVHLCRLRHFDANSWGFGFFAYSSEKYELSMFSSGSFVGTPEEAFDIAASVYLTEE